MKRIEFISFDDFQKVYRGEKRKDMKLCLLLGYGSGLRISEIVGLRKQVSICCNKEVEMRRVPQAALNPLGRKVKRYFCPACNKELTAKQMRRSNTEWAIPPLTADKIDLQAHQIRLDIAKGQKWRVTVTSPLLTQDLVNLLPLKVPRSTLQDRFVKLCKRVLNQRMSFHILRHGFGNYQANVAKLPLPIVQQLMGHSRLDTTGIYTKVNPEYAISEAWKAMGGKD